MKTAFTPFSIGQLTLPNRFVRSATFEGMADTTGHATPRLIETMRRLAEGEVGLIISGHAFVSAEGRAGKWQLACDSEACVPGLKEMADAVHEAGGNNDTSTGPRRRTGAMP